MKSPWSTDRKTNRMSTPEKRDLSVKTLSADSQKVAEGILLGSLGLTQTSNGRTAEPSLDRRDDPFQSLSYS